MKTTLKLHLEQIPSRRENSVFRISELEDAGWRKGDAEGRCREQKLDSIENGVC